MKQFNEIYSLKNDTARIKMIQEASLEKNSHSGYKLENGLLFGTNEWFNAIESGLIPKNLIKGVISRVFMTGHNDYPEFEIEHNGSKSTWASMGSDLAYKVGRVVELAYVEQKFKRPSTISGINSKCVIHIRIMDQ